MPSHDLIVVGASAGGVDALIQMTRGLPQDLQAAVCIVLHTSAMNTSRLPTILSRSGALPATHAVHGEPIQYGHIYIAPPDHHLLVREGFLELSRGPRENHMRPAIDPLFRSAARAYGERVVGVVLSGTLGDGSMGLMAINAHKGIAIVQDPQEATFGSMPRAAIKYAEVDYVLPVAHISPLLASLTHGSVSEKGTQTMSSETDATPAVIQRDISNQEQDLRPNTQAMYSCPDCGGILWQINNGMFIQFHCHVGHTWSPELLLVQKSEELETALWSSVRLLKEKAILSYQMATRVRQTGDDERADQIEEQAQFDEHHIQIIREMLLEVMPNPISQSSIINKDYEEAGEEGGG